MNFANQREKAFKSFKGELKSFKQLRNKFKNEVPEAVERNVVIYKQRYFSCVISLRQQENYSREFYTSLETMMYVNSNM